MTCALKVQDSHPKAYLSHVRRNIDSIINKGSYVGVTL